MTPCSLSVVLAVRNGALTVGAALADLVTCLGEKDELLVIDDGSQDATPHVLTEWLDRDSRIRRLTTVGSGLVNALNLGIKEASHEWIARADADDRYSSDRLALQRQGINRDVVLVTGDYRLTSPNGPSTCVPCSLGPPFVALSLINPQRVPHPGVVFRRDAVIAAGGYRSEDFPAEDLGLLLRLSAEGDFVGVPGLIVDWTMTSGSISHSRQAEQRSATQKLLAAWRPALLNQVDDVAVSRELAGYEASSHARERALLLLRDLRAWHRRGEHLPGEGEILRASARHPLSTLRAGWRLSHEARLRRRARSEIVSSL